MNIVKKLCFVLVIDKILLNLKKIEIFRNRLFGIFQREFYMSDIIQFCVSGVEVGKYIQLVSIYIYFVWYEIFEGLVVYNFGSFFYYF